MQPRESITPSLIFGKYEVIRRLAIGGMGEIFLARQTGVAGFDRLVILKSLLPDLADNKDWVDQFLDEARVAATLNHPNIVGIFEVGLWDGVYFIAMEYIEGENIGVLMKNVVERKNKVDLRISAQIIHDAAMGLDHAHHASDAYGKPLNIVHRDISPQNIMVRTDGVTKVVDFGIAKAANRSTRTQTGVLKGKIRYMSPEQLSRQTVDARTDQFALGIVLWEMVAGRRLFRRSEDEIDILKRLTSEDVAPPSSSYPDVPKELDQIVARMLARDPDKRFPRCKDAASALRAYLEQTGSRGEPPVAVLVQTVLGARIKQKTADLTPSKENFFIPLGPQKRSDASESNPTLQPKTVSQGGRPDATKENAATPLGGGRAALVVATAVALTAMLGASAWWLTRPVESPAPPPPTAPIEPPPRPRVAPPVTPPKLHIESEPSGASVRVGSMLLGSTPVEITTLAPDASHTVIVEKGEHQPTTIEVKLTAGEEKRIRVTLTAAPIVRPPPPAPRHERPRPKPAPPEPAPPPVAGPTGEGSLTLKTTPWTKISIDGQPFGVTPVFKIRLPTGVHDVHLVNEEAGIDARRKITIKPGETTKVDLRLP